MRETISSSIRLERREKKRNGKYTNPLKVSVSMINLSKKNANFSRRGRDIDTT
jgi:hypothetical protein